MLLFNTVIVILTVLTKCMIQIMSFIDRNQLYINLLKNVWFEHFTCLYIKI